MELVYEELRRLAHHQMANVPPADTLQPTALVHEAYLRLVGRETQPAWEDRGHFFAAAARAMRDIIVEQARRHASMKRGGDRLRITLDELIISAEAQSEDLVALEAALRRLEKSDSTSAQVVMLRYFAGLSVEETARAMGTSPATVKRHWSYARAWLRGQIRGEPSEAEGGSGDGR
jgi:RNA polymerase sigma factor (TIGR02999 family)